MRRKKREYTYEEWKKALDLHNKYKLGHIRISRILDMDEYTVRSWLYYGIIPPVAKWTAKPCNEPECAIGVLHRGNGSVCKSRLFKNKPWYQYVIELGTIDKEFGEIFSRAVSRILDVNYRKPRWKEKEKKWQIVYRSYKKTEKNGIKGFKPYIEYSKETVKYYLRGLYVSEGNNNENKQIFLYISDIKLLKYVQCLLKEYFDIIATGPYLVHETGIKIVIKRGGDSL